MDGIGIGAEAENCGDRHCGLDETDAIPKPKVYPISSFRDPFWSVFFWELAFDSASSALAFSSA
jgi:hypothetical protein